VHAIQLRDGGELLLDLGLTLLDFLLVFLFLLALRLPLLLQLRRLGCVGFVPLLSGRLHV